MWEGEGGREQARGGDGVGGSMYRAPDGSVCHGLSPVSSSHSTIAYE